MRRWFDVSVSFFIGSDGWSDKSLHRRRMRVRDGLRLVGTRGRRRGIVVGIVVGGTGGGGGIRLVEGFVTIK